MFAWTDRRNGDLAMQYNITRTISSLTRPCHDDQKFLRCQMFLDLCTFVVRKSLKQEKSYKSKALLRALHAFISIRSLMCVYVLHTIYSLGHRRLRHVHPRASSQIRINDTRKSAHRHDAIIASGKLILHIEHQNAPSSSSRIEFIRIELIRFSH